jgi:hypothetical protein
MPKRVGRYRTAWLSERPSVRGVALAEALETVSHDGLTSVRPAAWSGQTRLDLAWRTLFADARGSLISDDTGLPQPLATAIEGLAWRSSSPEGTPVVGLSRGRLGWTTGLRRVPVGLRRWRRGGASPSAWAVEWLSSARHRLGCRPASGLCAAW